MGDVRAAWDAVTSRPGLADVLRRLPRGPSSLPVLADVLYLRTVADLLDSAWGELAREAAVARTQADGFVKDGRRFSELAGEAPLRVDLLVAAGRRPPRQAIDDLLALRESWHLESAAGPEQCP